MTKRTACASAARVGMVATVSLTCSACRTAVVVSPRDPNTQTVVTVEQRPATQPGGKGLIVREPATTERQ